MNRWREAIVLVLVALLGVQSCRIKQAEERGAQLALRADSIEAAADSTRAVNAKALERLGDSLHGVERRVVQERQRADALDRALGRERVARFVTQAVIDSLRIVLGAVTDTVNHTDSVRHVWFTVDTMPYSGTASVRIPPQPERPTLDLRLTVAVLPLGLRLGCGGAVNGIRPASVTLTGPRWATLSLDSLSQSPDICRSPALQPKGPSRTRWMVVGGALALLLRQVVR